MKPEYGSVEWFKEILVAEENNIHFFTGMMHSVLNPAEGSPAEILKRARNLMKAYRQNRGLSDVTE